MHTQCVQSPSALYFSAIAGDGRSMLEKAGRFFELTSREMMDEALIKRHTSGKRKE